LTSPSSPQEGRSPIPRWARAADALTIALVGFAVFIALTGGVRFQLLGVWISARSVARTLVVAAAVAAIRHWRVRRPSLVRRVRSGLARVPQRLVDDALAVDERHLFEATLRPWWRRLAGFAGLTLTYGAIVAALTYPQVVELDSVPDLGDPLLSVWRLGWVAHQLVRDPLHLFDGNMFYPERLTLTYSDSHIVPALAGAPLLWLGVHQVVAYNLLFLSGFVFSGVTMFMLVHALTGRRDAALVSGAIFAVYPYRAEHYSHFELQMTMWMPLLLLAVHRTLARGRLQDGLRTGLLLALQTLSSLYYGMYMMVYLVPVAGALWVRSRVRRTALLAFGGGAVLAAVLVAPVASAYLANRAMVGERDASEVAYYSALPEDYLSAHYRSRLYGQRTWVPHNPERELFPTITPVAVALVGAWPPLSLARIGYVVALGVSFDASLGSNGGLFSRFRTALPGFRGLRVPARFSVLVGMTLAVLAGYGLARMLRARPPAVRVLITAGVLAAVLVEMHPRIRLEPVWPRAPGIYASIRDEPDAVLAEFPMPRDGSESAFDTRYLYFSTFHWHRLVNGNSGHFPPSYLQLLSRMRDFPDDAALAYLRRRGVDYVAVHGRFYPPPDYEQIIAKLDADPGVSLVATSPWDGSESRLYRLLR